MQVDFLDAHARHWADAETLFNGQRFANADHLFGVSAECGLKKMMLVFGMPYDQAKDFPSDAKDRKHINDIWMRFESYRCGYASGAGYLLPATNPFHDWDISQRYAHQSGFDQIRAQSHQSGAQIVCALIKKAKIEGIL
jgi:hypothetical protein